jgi:hypothetical protein
MSGGWMVVVDTERMGGGHRLTELYAVYRVGKLGPESVRSALWTDENGQFQLPLEA